MKYRWDKKYLYWGVTIFLILAAGMALATIFFQWQSLLSTVNFVLGLFTPIFYGIIIAFLLNPIVKFFERVQRRIFRKKIQKAKNPKRSNTAIRAVAVIVTLLFMLGIVVGLFWMVIPALIESISRIFSNLNTYYTNLTDWLNSFSQSEGMVSAFIQEGLDTAYQFINNWVRNDLPQHMQALLPAAAESLGAVIGFFSNLIIGIVVSVYLLFSKEKFIAQMKKLTYACLKKERANAVIEVSQHANRMFSGFISGRILDSAIIGILCFIAMLILGLPYPHLIAVIVGVTNIIPFFGPFIGAIPSGFLILMIDPWQCLYFVILIIVLQQIDGNIIDPRIQGNVTGLSGFWILLSITVFGGLFGLVGIVLGVPSFAVLYGLVRRWVNRSLKKRKMDLALETYMEDGRIYENDPEEDLDHGYTEPVKVDPATRAAEQAARKRKRKASTWLAKKMRSRKEKKGGVQEPPDDDKDDFGF